MNYITSFLLLFVKPRKAIHFFVEKHFSLPVLIGIVAVSGMIGGISIMMTPTESQNLGSFLGVNEIILSVVIFLVAWLVSSFLIYVVTKKIGGTATFQDMKITIVWTGLAGIAISQLPFILLLVSGYLSWLVSFGVLIWSLWITISALSEVVRIKFWKIAVIMLGIYVVLYIVLVVSGNVFLWQTGQQSLFKSVK
tara:strand:+ start:351 stop:935 length:585 start_codon:yes stop_codon:yes gene_type:complete